MSDIVEQLRKRAELHGAGPDAIVHLKAGDEIERLRTSHAELLVALKIVMGDATHGQKESWTERCMIARAAIEKAENGPRPAMRQHRSRPNG